MSFNVGDRVRLISPDGDSGSSAKVGDLGTVTDSARQGGAILSVNMDGTGATHRFPERFERVAEAAIKTGDRVRVTFEDTVVAVSEDGTVWFELEDMAECEVGYRPGDGSTESIEKVEQPLVAFGPGEFVRHRRGTVYLVTEEGVVHLDTGKVFTRDLDWREKYLTSRYYDKIELHEAPL